MNKRYYFMTIILSAILLFTSPFCAKQVYAKGTEKLSQKKMVTCREEEETLSLLNASGKVKWTSSNKNVVKITKKSGKKKQSIVFQTGNPGKAVIQAKVGKKTYKCKVTVKNSVSKASLVKTEQTDTSLSVTVKLSNRGNDYLGYGYGYWVEKLENGTWKKLAIQEYDGMGVAVPDVLIQIKGRTSVEETYTLYEDGKISMYQKSDFPTGTYRIHVGGLFAKDEYNYVVFKLK